MTAPDMRVGDAERDAALAALGEHFAAGRLTHEEYDERTDAVWTARTAGDLAVLFDDLPGGAGRVSSGHPGRRRRVPARVLRRMAFVPFVPFMIGLVVLSVVTHVPFVLIGIALWVLIPRRHRRPRSDFVGAFWPHRHWGQAIGNRRPADGSWA